MQKTQLSPKRRFYSVSAASQVTGIPASTIRSWERRYRAVQPDRSVGGQRRYSEQDLMRLHLLRELVGNGHAISAIATMSQQDLEQTAAEVKPTPAPVRVEDAAKAIRTMTVGAHAGAHLAAAEENIPGLQLQRQFATYEDALADDSGMQADLLVCHFPSLRPHQKTHIESLRAHFRPLHTVIVYEFAPNSVVRLLRDRDVSLLQTFAHLGQLLRVLVPGGLHGIEGNTKSRPPAAPRFDARIERQFSSEELVKQVNANDITLLCECPRHLAQMLLQFYEFEEYTKGCEVGTPADARTHQEILVQTVAARSCVEEALSRALLHVATTHTDYQPPVQHTRETAEEI